MFAMPVDPTAPRLRRLEICILWLAWHVVRQTIRQDGGHIISPCDVHMSIRGNARVLDLENLVDHKRIQHVVLLIHRVQVAPHLVHVDRVIRDRRVCLGHLKNPRKG